MIINYFKVILLVSTTILLCISTHTKAIQREFKNISIEDGLPHYTINAMLQDSEGYIWIATNDGLVKFDSYKYTTYKPSDHAPNSIKAHKYLSLSTDSKNNIWIGTDNSLKLYNRELDNFKTFYFENRNEEIIERVPISDIYEYSDSTYLVATDGGGLYVFNPGRGTYQQYKTILNIEKSNSSLRLSKIYVDKTGNIWLGGLGNGLLKFYFASRSIEKVDKSNKIKEIRDIIPISSHEILIGTYGDGLWVFNTYSKTFKEHRLSTGVHSAAVKRIFSLYRPNQFSNLFIGTDGGGLLEYNIQMDQTIHYCHYGYNPQSISNNVIKTILMDKEQNLWTGHYKGGISFAVHRKPFYNIRHNPAMPNSLSNNLVNCILKDSKNRIIIGTDGGGLNMINPNGILENKSSNTNNVINQLDSKCILALHKDKSKNIWIGTYLDGIYIYPEDTEEVTHFGSTTSPKIKLTNDDIRCFYEDRDGRMWIGTNGGGINIYNPENDSVTVIQRDEKDIDGTLSLDWIRSITGDSYGFIWIGTVYGLNKYDPISNSLTKYFFNSKDSNSLSNDFVYSIFEDSEQNIWVATAYGLNKYNRKEDSFSTLTIQDGLPDNIIYNMVEDIDQNLWISTNNGISRFSPSSNTFANFDTSDGLLSSAFINGAIYKSNTNIVYLGSIKGLTYFNPVEIKNTINESPLEITDLKLFNKSVKIGAKFNDRIILNKHISKTEEIKISYKENFIGIEYTLLNFNNSGKINYAYKLEGFDQAWVNAGENQRQATYTDLPPGKYTFKVKTTNLPINQEKNLNILVSPPFHQTFWFRLSLVILVGGLIYYWNRVRIIKIKSQKEVLVRKMNEDKLKFEKEQITLRNKNLQYEMSSKNAQLTSSTLLISHKNDIMREIKNRLSAFPAEFNSSDLNNELNNLIKSIDQEFKVEEDWKRFEEHFNHIHKDFFKRLKSEYPDLSPTYIKLSAYLRMNLSSKEIASLMNISVRGVEKARSRLRQKLEIPQETKLSTYIGEM